MGGDSSRGTLSVHPDSYFRASKSSGHSPSQIHSLAPASRRNRDSGSAEASQATNGSGGKGFGKKVAPQVNKKVPQSAEKRHLIHQRI